MEYPTYLIHYGIPGQKWGVRRYQNEDGTWTEEGKFRRNVPHYGGKGITAPLTSRGYGQYDYEKKEWNKSVKGPEVTDYIIKKGSQYKRFTMNPDEKFAKRTYVGSDPLLYDEYMLVNKEGDRYISTLETKKDVLVAGKKTLDSILESIGDKSAKDAIEALNNKKPDIDDEKYNIIKRTKDGVQYVSGTDKEKYDEDHKKYVDNAGFMYEDKYGLAEKVIKELKNRGYDALADPEDSPMYSYYKNNGMQNSFDPEATIFINDVLKNIKTTKLWDENTKTRYNENGEKLWSLLDDEWYVKNIYNKSKKKT